jgi:hypothetical protein
MRIIYHFDQIVKKNLLFFGVTGITLFPTQALSEDRDAGSEAFGGRWARGIPQQAGCVAQGAAEYFQAKWLTLAARKIRPNKQLLFKPSGYPWRLRKNVQNSV